MQTVKRISRVPPEFQFWKKECVERYLSPRNGILRSIAHENENLDFKLPQKTESPAQLPQNFVPQAPSVERQCKGRSICTRRVSNQQFRHHAHALFLAGPMQNDEQRAAICLLSVFEVAQLAPIL